MRINRLSRIEEEVHAQGAVTLKDLAEEFEVSLNTIRRDIDALIKKGEIEKVYGGVVSKLNSNVLPISGRSNVNVKAKQKIGRLVAQYIRDNAKIFIDSGTTPAQIVPFLENKKNITIVTNNLNVIHEASKYSNIKLLCMGGLFDSSQGAFYSSRVIEGLTDLNFDYVLIGSTGVSLKHGLTINSFLGVDVKRWLVSNLSQRTILMADISKYDKTALYSFGNFQDIHAVAVDDELPDEYAQAVIDNNILLL